MIKLETLLDTCCIINLCAIQRPPVELFAEFPLKWKIASAVAREEVSIRPHETAGRNERQKIDLRPCLDSGVIDLCDARTSDELSLYIEFATELDDGEAMSLAIAVSRGWSLATDDIPARAAAKKLNVKTYCTPQLLRIWVEANNVSVHDAAMAIGRIERLARYIPQNRLPDADWWSKVRSP